ncbi:MAG: biopolymer transporter ExbD [Methylotenera sp.]|nr:biopolymer transporter ExbD [Oligoflexia bacterium]
MSAGVESGNGQDFELNLASIIDCFTVLIAFMLASASFLSIGILDAGIAAAGATTASTGTPPAVNVTVELKPGQVLQVVVSGKRNDKILINPGSDQKWDLEKLTAQLKTLKGQWPDLNSATLVADNDVQYRDVVLTMDVTRKTLPAVMLGGF